jgi:hypothetical protein
MDHSSARVSPHCHYPPAKAAPSMLSLTPFLTQHKAGRVPFRFHSARVGWPAFQRNLPSIPPRHCGHQERERVPESGSSSGFPFVVA